MADDDYTMGEFWRDMKPELKERRRIARNSAHEGMKAFFQRNGVEFEEGENTLIFRTPQGTVAYYPPSKRMQHKTTWRTCSPTACMNYVNYLRAAEPAAFFQTSPFSMSAVSYDNRRPSTAH